MLGPDGQAFRCSKCDAGSMAVVNSRPTEEGEVRRRRLCGGCGYRITTLEVEIADPIGGRVAHIRTLEAKAARYDTLAEIMALPLFTS